jgi:hypothetical protein
MPAVVEVEPPKLSPQETLETKVAPPGDGGVRCPKCHWKPGDDDRWACVCEHVWNTFATHGRCPGCGKQWHETQCLHCGEWSPHEAWYVDETVSFSA